MSTLQHESCIKALSDCIAACAICARSGASETNEHAMADCVMLNTDCMEICRLAISCMERDSKMVTAICEACADACERCQEECDKYLLDYCKVCAEACRTCAMECRALVAFMHSQRHHSPDAVVAGLRN